MNTPAAFSACRTRLLRRCALLLTTLACTAPVWASTPVEKVVCTQAPRAQWMSEQQARDVFRASSYVLVRFKVSRGNCHEFYAVDATGAVVEAYLHPVTGEAVRFTRIPAPPAPGSVSVSAWRP
jgi:hypothetical protein